jgi:hypothetical protein
MSTNRTADLAKIVGPNWMVDGCALGSDDVNGGYMYLATIRRDLGTSVSFARVVRSNRSRPAGSAPMTEAAAWRSLVADAGQVIAQEAVGRRG